MSDEEANTAPVAEKPKTAQDYYANFIGKQAGKTSLFDTRNTRPVTKKDVADSTGKSHK